MSQTLREFYDAVVSFQSKALSDAASYNQVNVLAGYAAIFAIWSAVSSSLPKWMVLTSGGLMTVSVIVYVSWTIANMIFLKTHHEAMAAAVTQGVEGFVDRVVEAEKRSLTRRDRIMKWWLPVVVAAGGTALVAAVMLAGAAFASVVGSPLTSRTPRDISNATDPESLGWRVKLLEQRSGDLGAFAISWPNESTKSGFVVANGMPMQVGVSDLRPKQLGYQPGVDRESDDGRDWELSSSDQSYTRWRSRVLDHSSSRLFQPWRNSRLLGPSASEAQEC